MSIRREATRVAVVIVNYQSYEELHGCLASVDRACGSASVVVVDHESKPDAADLLKERFPEIQLRRVPGNDGFAAGVNAGARATSSQFILLLNPDCVLEPDACCRLVDWLESHPDVAVAGPRIRNADGTVQPSARRFPDFTTAIAGRSSWLTRVLPGNPMSRHNLPARDPADATPVEVDWVSGACMCVRRRRSRRSADWTKGSSSIGRTPTSAAASSASGWRTMYVPTAGAVHVGGRSSRHAADASLEAFHQSAFRLFRKHAGPAAQVLAPLVYAGLRLRLAFMKRLVRSRRS